MPQVGNRLQGTGNSREATGNRQQGNSRAALGLSPLAKKKSNSKIFLAANQEIARIAKIAGIESRPADDTD
jgi:hypothetical protein